MPNRWLMNELAHSFRKFRSFVKDGVVCVTDCPMTEDEREKVRDIAIGVREVDTHVIIPDERMKLLEERLHDLLESYPEAQLTRQEDGIVLKYRGHCYDMDCAFDIIARPDRLHLLSLDLQKDKEYEDWKADCKATMEIPWHEIPWRNYELWKMTHPDTEPRFRPSNDCWFD